MDFVFGFETPQEKILQKRGKYYEWSPQGEAHLLLEVTVEAYELYLAQDFDEAKIAEILRFDARMRGKEKAYKYLSYRPYFEGEIGRKLRDQGFDRELCAELLEELRDEGLLDDYELALRFSAEKLKTEGKDKVLYRLLQKGLTRSFASRVLDVSLKENGLDEFEICFNAAKRKAEALRIEKPCNRKEEMKLVNFLKGRGFSASNIVKALKELKK